MYKLNMHACRHHTIAICTQPPTDPQLLRSQLASSTPFVHILFFSIQPIFDDISCRRRVQSKWCNFTLTVAAAGESQSAARQWHFSRWVDGISLAFVCGTHKHRHCQRVERRRTHCMYVWRETREKAEESTISIIWHKYRPARLMSRRATNGARQARKE